MRFADRRDAGQRLATALDAYRKADAIVYALPRGGVVVGAEIAHALNLPLDLVITRKIGHPDNPEYAVGAITEAGEFVANEAERARLDPEWLAEAIARELVEAARRRQTYSPNRRFYGLDHRTASLSALVAIIVDDGVATGLTLRAAISSLRAARPKKIVAAVPVAPADTAAVLRREADELVALIEDDRYRGAVGAYYASFPEVTDAEVITLLHPRS